MYTMAMFYLDNSLKDPKQLHDFLFGLFDFAAYLADDASRDQQTCLMIVAYIEDMMDVYGRQLITQSAKDAGLNAEESLKEANKRLDIIRAVLNTSFWGEELDNTSMHKTIDEAARRLKRNWGTRQ